MKTRHMMSNKKMTKNIFEEVTISKSKMEKDIVSGCRKFIV